MTLSKKVLNKDGKTMLSARAAAKRLLCAPDYIGRLCREGRLEGERIDGAWYVLSSSLKTFEASRELHAQERSEQLSELRRKESMMNTRLPELLSAPQKFSRITG